MAIRAVHRKFSRIAGLIVAALVLSTGAATAAAAADTIGPQGSVGGLQSPVRGTLQLEIDASDDRSGLASASAFIDGVLAATVPLGTGCADAGGTTPDSATPGCPLRVSRVPLPVDLSTAAVGAHTLRIRVTDAAGNASDLYASDIVVAGPDPVYTSTVQLVIGDPRAAAQAAGQGTQSQTVTTTIPACIQPHLSMWLDERPLRISLGKPVLRSAGRYRYRGRLTCMINGSRKGAPRGTPVDILFKIRRRSHSVTGMTTYGKGKLTVVLAYRTSRTLIFRHRSSIGQSTVRLPIVITRTKKGAQR